MGRFTDISGMKSGSLTAIKRVENRGLETMYECLCECGNTHIARASSIKSGMVKSCGCLTVRSHPKHNKSNSKTYHVWEAMKQRCNNKKHPRYADYGGRGIFLCDEWNKFESFLNDMGEQPENMTLDRIDNDYGYTKENCRWVTQSEQMRNTRITNSKDVGLRLNEKSGIYTVRITVLNKAIHIGTYKDKNEAVAARRNAEQKYWRNQNA